MRRDQVIEFVATDFSRTSRLREDRFEFTPSKRFWQLLQLLQRAAFWFLRKTGALPNAFDEVVQTTRHLIEADKFIDRILKQKRALFDGYRLEAQRLLVGSEDYAELMNTPEIHHYFTFDAELHYRSSDGKRTPTTTIVGLRVEVIPWMRGMVVMP